MLLVWRGQFAGFEFRRSCAKCAIQYTSKFCLCGALLDAVSRSFARSLARTKHSINRNFALHRHLLFFVAPQARQLQPAAVALYMFMLLSPAVAFILDSERRRLERRRLERRRLERRRLERISAGERRNFRSWPPPSFGAVARLRPLVRLVLPSLAGSLAFCPSSLPPLLGAACQRSLPSTILNDQRSESCVRSLAHSLVLKCVSP